MTGTSYFLTWNRPGRNSSKTGLIVSVEVGPLIHISDINLPVQVPVNETNVPSGYTPLHQAAWRGSSVEVVKNLLRLGAWREPLSLVVVHYMLFINYGTLQEP